ncbi:Oidioi.mRNA.OKI2018_I69.XSR.g13414.t1.cds [Oikopleura dioica]|uniref:Oidioi.mRNA.OKI2018_I69.XSR.g13414.t1.cds n=1 Tax=Oikopleura dioica TaxID=34765 RepID=A0ABN7S8I3_OIKDI|nr:Oidioi.mRNA.OKI2018_I69.XSR.g13414.t1.cds [Oikopleura dioica]
MIYKYDPVKYCREDDSTDDFNQTSSNNCDLLATETIQYSRCVWDFSSRKMSQIFLIGRMVTGFLLPILIITVSYAFIWRTASNLQKSSSASRSKRVNRMIACVIASFVVTWTPNHLLTLSMLLIDKNQPWMFYWNSVTQVFASVSAIANPIIYAFTRGDLRRVGKEWYHSSIRSHLPKRTCCSCSIPQQKAESVQNNHVIEPYYEDTDSDDAQQNVKSAKSSCKNGNTTQMPRFEIEGFRDSSDEKLHRLCSVHEFNLTKHGQTIIFQRNK